MNVKPVALTTGAGRGIGRAIVLELARQGFDIAVNDIVFDPSDRTRGLNEVMERAEALGARVLAAVGDISSLDDQARLVSEVLGAFGRIDVLVNNAGIAPEKRSDILETGPESYDRVMAVNARGAFFLSQRIAREMIKRREGEKRAGSRSFSSLRSRPSSRRHRGPNTVFPRPP